MAELALRDVDDEIVKAIAEVLDTLEKHADCIADFAAWLKWVPVFKGGDAMPQPSPEFPAALSGVVLSANTWRAALPL